MIDGGDSSNSKGFRRDGRGGGGDGARLIEQNFGPISQMKQLISTGNAFFST